MFSATEVVLHRGDQQRVQGLADLNDGRVLARIGARRRDGLWLDVLAGLGRGEQLKGGPTGTNAKYDYALAGLLGERVHTLFAVGRLLNAHIRSDLLQLAAACDLGLYVVSPSAPGRSTSWPRQRRDWGVETIEAEELVGRFP